jgi:hypothetical protein
MCSQGEVPVCRLPRARGGRDRLTRLLLTFSPSIRSPLRQPKPTLARLPLLPPPPSDTFHLFPLVFFCSASSQTSLPPPRRRPAPVVTCAPTQGHHDVRSVVLFICIEGIELASSTTATTSSSSCEVTSEIRPLRSSSDLSEHARELLVSLCSFSPLSPSVFCLLL